MKIRFNDGPPVKAYANSPEAQNARANFARQNPELARDVNKANPGSYDYYDTAYKDVQNDEGVRAAEERMRALGMNPQGQAPHWSQAQTPNAPQWMHQDPQALGWKIDPNAARGHGYTEDDINQLQASHDMSPYAMEQMQAQGTMYSPQRQYEAYLAEKKRQEELARQAAMAQAQRQTPVENRGSDYILGTPADYDGHMPSNLGSGPSINYEKDGKRYLTANKGQGWLGLTTEFEDTPYNREYLTKHGGIKAY